MNCPFCNETMEKGILQSVQIILWAKKKHYLSLLAKEDEVQLAREYLDNACLPAWICKTCKKVVVDYSAKEE